MLTKKTIKNVIRATAFIGMIAPLSAMANIPTQTAYGNAVDYSIAGDYDDASKIFIELAEQNDGRAQFNLAMMYHAGLGVPEDEAKAVELYHKAAANGVPEAMEYLVAAYSEGWFGLQKDEKKAAYWQSKLDNL